MLLEQVQTPQNTSNVIQPWRYPFKTPVTRFSPLVSKSSLNFFANKREPRIAKVNSTKYLNLTYSTIQKLKRSRTASWLLRFELCISQVFKEDFRHQKFVSKSSPVCCSFHLCAVPSGFQRNARAKCLLIRSGRKWPNREGDSPWTRR